MSNPRANLAGEIPHVAKHRLD